MASKWERVEDAYDFLKKLEESGFSPNDVVDLTWGDGSFLLKSFKDVHRGSHIIVPKSADDRRFYRLMPTDRVLKLPRTDRRDTSKVFYSRKTFGPPSGSVQIPLPEQEKLFRAATFRGHNVGEGMTLAEVVKVVGGMKKVRNKHVAGRWQIHAAIEAQYLGSNEPLVSSGTNYFFVQAETEEKVGALCLHSEWAFHGIFNVYTRPLSSEWILGESDQVFLRD